MPPSSCNAWGRGILLGHVDGVPSAEVVVLGGGVVGTSAAEMAIGMGANVTVAARSPETQRHLSQIFGTRVRFVRTDAAAIEALCISADVVIGAALVPGGAAPKLIPARTVAAMKSGSVIVDVSIDQGGCAETSRPTTHSQPTFVVDGVVHYCVANMPARCREHRHSPSTMPHGRLFWRSPTKDSRRR